MSASYIGIPLLSLGTWSTYLLPGGVEATVKSNLNLGQIELQLTSTWPPSWFDEPSVLIAEGDEWHRQRAFNALRVQFNPRATGGGIGGPNENAVTIEVVTDEDIPPTRITPIGRR